MLKNKKIIVTGGAGFIGSNLVHTLAKVDLNNKVIVIDDLSTGRIENIQGLIDNKKIEFIKSSITDLVLLQKIFRGVDFVFVDDVVNANILLAEKEETSSKIYNVASGNDISIDELAASILEMDNGFQKNIEILYEDFQPGDIRYSSADVSKIKMMGFEAICSLKEGLDKTNNYFSKQMEPWEVMVIEN